MLMYRDWYLRQDGGLSVIKWDGWFLLGVIPIYVRRRIVK